MSVACSVTCVDCKINAPEVGDSGYFGGPSLLDKRESITAYDIFPFSYLYRPFEELGIRPYDLERFKAFLGEHEGHKLYLSSDHDDELPNDLSQALKDIAERGTAVKDFVAEEKRRDERIGSREFVLAAWQLSCIPCGATHGASQPEALRYFEKLEVPADTPRRFLERIAEADEWNSHRVFEHVDFYGEFIEGLIEFLRLHGDHALRASLEESG